MLDCVAAWLIVAAMTKKHFIELADLIKNLPHSCQVIQGMVSVEDLTRVLADFCENQNENFNRSRWLGYIAGKCGKNGGKI